MVPAEITDAVDASILGAGNFCSSSIALNKGKTERNYLHSTGDIIFHDVRFSYNPSESHSPLFQSISLAILAGQKVGLVGYSGGGKSTFVHLILRLYDVTGGKTPSLGKTFVR